MLPRCKCASLHLSMEKDQWKFGLHASQMDVAFVNVREQSSLRQSSRHQF